jgi:hypothetical protein
MDLFGRRTRNRLFGEISKGEVVGAWEKADRADTVLCGSRAGTHATHCESLTAEVPSLEDQPP